MLAVGGCSGAAISAFVLARTLLAGSGSSHGGGNVGAGMGSFLDFMLCALLGAICYVAGLFGAVGMRWRGERRFLRGFGWFTLVLLVATVLVFWRSTVLDQQLKLEMQRRNNAANGTP